MQDQQTKIARLRNHIKFRHSQLQGYVSVTCSEIDPQFITIEFPLSFGHTRSVILGIKREFGFVVFRDMDQQYSKFHLY
jgi:hypothetical protein